MSSLVHFPGFEDRREQCEESDPAAGPFGFSSFFRSLPPERVGLNGEYDHSGLAKRVERALHERFSPPQLEKLRVAQRGRVVVLAGQVANHSLLRQFVETARDIHGATDVETLGVRLVERS